MEESVNERLGEYLHELARGEMQALEEIYKILNKVFYSTANIYYPQKADIEDAVSDFLEKLVDIAHKFRNNDNAYAWITKSYDRFLLNKVKHDKVELRYLSELANNLIVEENSRNDVYYTNYLFARELFSGLSGYEQKLVRYKYYLGYTLDELAELFNKPRTTLQYQLSKIAEKLRKNK